jgi:hypothetical protein
VDVSDVDDEQLDTELAGKLTVPAIGEVADGGGVSDDEHLPARLTETTFRQEELGHVPREFSLLPRLAWSNVGEDLDAERRVAVGKPIQLQAAQARQCVAKPHAQPPFGFGEQGSFCGLLNCAGRRMLHPA